MGASGDGPSRRRRGCARHVRQQRPLRRSCPPAPTTRVAERPTQRAAVSSTTRRRSSTESVQYSPVLPHGTRRSMPSSSRRSTTRSSPASSIADPSGLNGVTVTPKMPVNRSTEAWPAIGLLGCTGPARILAPMPVDREADGASFGAPRMVVSDISHGKHGSGRVRAALDPLRRAHPHGSARPRPARARRRARRGNRTARTAPADGHRLLPRRMDRP